MRLQKELNSLSPRNVVAVLVAESGGMEGDPSAGGGFRAHAGSPGLNEHHTYDLGGTGAGAAAAASAAAVAAGGTISKVTLLLSPRSKEQSFWQSVRVLKLLDGLGLFYSAMLNVMLIRKFGWGHNHPDWLWHFLPVVAYLAASSLQLCLLVSKPDAYHRHRFVINLANRLVKAATVTWAAVNMSQNTVMVQFTATLNSVPHAAPGEHSAATYMKILRTVASLPMLWVSHCINFLLPFWLIFPFQVFTLLAVSRVMPSIVCALLAQPDHIIQAALAIATHVQAVVRVLISVALPLPMRWPWDFPPTPDTVAKDLLMLVAVTFTMILLIIPCVVAYYVELLWKTDYLKACARNTQQQQQGQQQQQQQQDQQGDTSLSRASSSTSSASTSSSEGSGPSSRSSLDAATQPATTNTTTSLQIWLTFDIVCLALLMCELGVHTVSGGECDCRFASSTPQP